MLKPETLNDPAKLRDLTVAELRAADHQLKEQQMKLRLQHAIGQVEKTHLIREARRQRARVLTLIGEKLAHGEHAPTHEEVAHAEAAQTEAPKNAKPHAKKAAPHAKAKAPAKKVAAKKPVARKAKSAAKAKPAAKKGAKKK